MLKGIFNIRTNGCFLLAIYICRSSKRKKAVQTMLFHNGQYTSVFSGIISNSLEVTGAIPGSECWFRKK